MSNWSQHLGDSPSTPQNNSSGLNEDFQEFDDEQQHQEPIGRAARQRELTTRRHKDITQEDVDLSKKLWQWGFLLLPFLWLVNYVFFRHALLQPTTPEEMKTNIRRSIKAFAIAIVIWLIWLIVFYTNMRGWAHALLIFSPETQVIKA